MLSCGHFAHLLGPTKREFSWRREGVANASVHLFPTNCNLNILEWRQVIICVLTAAPRPRPRPHRRRRRRRIWTIFRCIIFSVFRVFFFFVAAKLMRIAAQQTAKEEPLLSLLRLENSVLLLSHNMEVKCCSSLARLSYLSRSLPPSPSSVALSLCGTACL